MEQTTTDGAKKRPTFLTVLCILTFVGVAFSLYSSFSNYVEFSKQASAASMASDAIGDAAASSGLDSLGVSTEQVNTMVNGMADMLGINPAKIATGYLIVGILNLLILIGALLMWKLKKMGFYLYALGELGQVGVMFIVIGGLVGGMMGIVMGVFALLFVILYAVNLKHMS